MRKTKKTTQDLNDSFRLRGYLEYVLRDAQTGRIVRRGKKENTVTAWGRGLALARLAANTSGSLFSAIAIGATSTAPTSNDSQLASYQTIRAFNNGTTLSTATNAAGTFTGSVSFASNETFANKSHGEFAIYNSGATGGGAVMFNRLNTNPLINFETSNTLAITITITN